MTYQVHVVALRSAERARVSACSPSAWRKAGSHVISEPRAVTFSGATDTALQAMGFQRKVVLSVSTFLIVAEIVARSDLIAIVPEGVVRDRADRLQILDPPLQVEGFDLLLIWHERTHGHAGHRWAREEIVNSVKS